MPRIRPFLLATFAAALFAAGAPSRAASVDGLAVDVANRSSPVLCAETDNVTLTLSSPETRRFVIEALHPAYIGALVADLSRPDFTACTQGPQSGAEAPTPTRETVYEDLSVSLVGYRRPALFARNDVPLRIGERTVTGLDTIELWVRSGERPEPALVFEPLNGAWSLRPLAPAHLTFTSFGSSVLIGPVDESGPVPRVPVKSIVFSPRTMTFTVEFEGGGGAAVRLATIDAERNALEVVFDRPIRERPFAVLRSMYVTSVNADATHVAVRAPDAAGWTEKPVMSFEGGRVTDLWLGRLAPSRHATSAPDLLLKSFQPR